VQQKRVRRSGFSYSTIPGVVVTVYAGTTLTLPNGRQQILFPCGGSGPVTVCQTLRLPPRNTASIDCCISAGGYHQQSTGVGYFSQRVNLLSGVNWSWTRSIPIVGERVNTYRDGFIGRFRDRSDPDPAHPGHRLEFAF